jgi:hypothetical protein
VDTPAKHRPWRRALSHRPARGDGATSCESRDVDEQHRGLLVLAFQGATRGQNLRRQMRWRVWHHTQRRISSPRDCQTDTAHTAWPTPASRGVNGQSLWMARKDCPPHGARVVQPYARHRCMSSANCALGALGFRRKVCYNTSAALRLSRTVWDVRQPGLSLI